MVGPVELAPKVAPCVGQSPGMIREDSTPPKEWPTSTIPRLSRSCRRRESGSRYVSQQRLWVVFFSLLLQESLDGGAYGSFAMASVKCSDTTRGKSRTAAAAALKA